MVCLSHKMHSNSCLHFQFLFIYTFPINSRGQGRTALVPGKQLAVQRDAQAAQTPLKGTSDVQAVRTPLKGISFIQIFQIKLFQKKMSSLLFSTESHFLFCNSKDIWVLLSHPPLSHILKISTSLSVMS